MLRPSLLLSSLAFAHCAQAVYLYVASYNGNITTLELTPNIGVSPKPNRQQPLPKYHAQEWTYDLDFVTTFNTTVQSPSWLTLNKQNNILYLVDEATGGAPNGTIVAYRTNPVSGHLAELSRTVATIGGVYATFFANGGALAVPHYTGSSLETYLVGPSGELKLLQIFTFTMSGPGPVPNRQDSPHPHETLLDPTGQYILVNDLGADLVRVFAIGSANGVPTITEMAPLKAAPGSGPRHGAFSLNKISGEYNYYLAAEISATITGYAVQYIAGQGGLQFTELPNGVYPSLGPGHAVPPTTTGESTGVTAELSFTPDGNFLIASNRRDLSFNKTTHPISYSIPSDSLATWDFQSNKTDGELEFLGLFPAGGSYPRQFAINKAGNLVAVGLQQSSRVVIIERDTVTGKFKRQVAEADVAGQLTCVVWDE